MSITEAGSVEATPVGSALPWRYSVAAITTAAVLRGYVDYRLTARLPHPVLPSEWVPLFSLFSAGSSAVAFLGLWLVVVALAHLSATVAGSAGSSYARLVRVSGYGLIPLGITSLVSAALLEPAILEVEAIYPGGSLDELARALAASGALARLRVLNGAAGGLALLWLTYAVRRVHHLSIPRSALCVSGPLTAIYALVKVL